MKLLDICKNVVNISLTLSNFFDHFSKWLVKTKTIYDFVLTRRVKNLMLKRIEISLEGGMLGGLGPWVNYDTDFSILDGLHDLANLPALLTLG